MLVKNHSVYSQVLTNQLHQNLQIMEKDGKNAKKNFPVSLVEAIKILLLMKMI